MSHDLKDYKEKRNLQESSEPRANQKESDHFLRFVIQHHDASSDHYDFRLEWNGILLSWAVPKGPSFNPSDKRLAIQVEDHPLDYRNFEGTIPEDQYGGGTVMIWDEGFWEISGDQAIEESLADGNLKFKLEGKRLKGHWTLVRWDSQSDDEQENWLLIKEKDDRAKDNPGIEDFTTSVRTGRTMSEIEKKKDKNLLSNPFDQVDVQLAKLVDEVPNSNDWIYETKYDGYRILTFIEEDSTRLLTRNKKDYFDKFSSLASNLSDFAEGRAMVLDGEVMVKDEEGKSDFQALQNHLNRSNNDALNYMVFDLLALDGKDLREYPLIKRKNILKDLLNDAPENIVYSDHRQEKGKEMFDSACDKELEGMIAKKRKSSYNSNRDGTWVKIKCDHQQEFVIGGYTLTDKREADEVSALLLGVYEGEELIYAGRAGTGMDEEERKFLRDQFQDLEKNEAPFKKTPKERSNEEITWLEVELMAEIRFAEWTEDNFLRQASYKGLREDKDPHEVVKEESD